MNIIQAEKPMMAVLTDEQTNALEVAIKTVDRNLSIHCIDYSIGTVDVAMTYNHGTPNEWTENKFISVNVNADSAPTIFHDVFNKVYDRCI